MFTLNKKINSWSGYRIWIIGASSGIGAAMSIQLQQRGCKLALSARNESALSQLARTDDLVMPLDVRDSTAMINAAGQIKSIWREIDLVIYAAGAYTPMMCSELDLQTAQEDLSVNLGGAYNLINAVLPGMRDNGHGAICLIASIAGLTGLPNAVAYGPSKAGMINLAQILYAELAATGIGIYLVNPGFVDTRLTRKNNFQMPALITTEQAAVEIIRGIEKGQFEIHFPKRFSYLVKLMSRLPDHLRFALLQRLTS